MSYLNKLVSKHGAENVFIHGMASPLRRTFFINYVSSSDEQVPTLFRIVEDEYKVSDDYKVEIKPLDEGLAKERFYISDLESLIDEGMFSVLVKADSTFDESFVEKNGIDRIYFYSMANPARRLLGMKIGPKRVIEAPFLFHIEKTYENLVYLAASNKEVWEPTLSYDKIDDLHRDDDLHMVLVRQHTRKEYLHATRA